MKIWAEQKHISIPSLFFQMYKQIGVTDEEAIFISHILMFQSEGIEFPTPMMVAERTSFDENTLSMMYQRLIQKGLIELNQQTDQNGILFEKVSVYPIWERILDKLEQQTIVEEVAVTKLDDRSIFTLIEQELGRLLSPIEIEKVSMWIDHDQHSPEMIKEAIKEAVLANKMSLRYIDRILFEWKKKQFKTIDQVKVHAEQFRNQSIQSKQKVSNQTEQKTRSGFYNWLDERE
jgi:DNA replication protein